MLAVYSLSPTNDTYLEDQKTQINYQVKPLTLEAHVIRAVSI